jgi:signal transduction histidine kinase
MNAELLKYQGDCKPAPQKFCKSTNAFPEQQTINLAGINTRLAGLQTKNATASRDLHKKISDTRHLVEQVVESIHRVACDLRPSTLDDLGFIPAIQTHITSLRGQSKLLIALKVPPDVEQLGMAEKIAFYRVIQESLCNVFQHAEATRATVSITHNSKGFRLSIRDNGRGFSVSCADFLCSENHLGLLGMRERIEMVGGIFSVKSKPGKFTAIHALLPQPEIPPVQRSS